MMHVEVFGPSGEMENVAAALDGLDGVTRVRRTEAAREGHSIVEASARPRVIHLLLDELTRLDVPESEITVTRPETVEWTATRRPETSLVWADVLGQAWLNARP